MAQNTARSTLPETEEELNETHAHFCPNFLAITSGPYPFVCALTMSKGILSTDPVTFHPCRMQRGERCMAFRAIYSGYLTTPRADPDGGNGDKRKKSPGRPTYEQSCMKKYGAIPQVVSKDDHIRSRKRIAMRIKRLEEPVANGERPVHTT